MDGIDVCRLSYFHSQESCVSDFALYRRRTTRQAKSLTAFIGATMTTSDENAASVSAADVASGASASACTALGISSSISAVSVDQKTAADTQWKEHLKQLSNKFHTNDDSFCVFLQPELRLERSDLKGLIKHHNFTWNICINYAQNCYEHLIIGTVLLSARDVTNANYSYIVTFDGCHFYDMQSNQSKAKPTLLDIFSLNKGSSMGRFTLKYPTAYRGLFQELGINVQHAMIGEHEADNNPEIVKWTVENVQEVELKWHALSDEAWTTFCKTLAGDTCGVMSLSLSLDQGLPVHLTEAIHKSLDDILLAITFQYGNVQEELDSVIDQIAETGHIQFIKLEGELEETPWFDCLIKLLKCKSLVEIEYSIQCTYHHDDIMFNKGRRKAIVDAIKNSGSLTAIKFDKGIYFGQFDQYIHDHTIQEVLKGRVFQQEIVRIAPTLESHGHVGTTYCGLLLCDSRVSGHPSTLFDVIKGIIPYIKYQWGRGLRKRAANLKRVIERNTRDLIEQKHKLQKLEH